MSTDLSTQKNPSFDLSVLSKASSSSELTTVTQDTLSKLRTLNQNDYSNISVRMLDQFKIADAGELGKSLNDLIATAEGLDPRKINTGLINKIKSKIFGVKHQLFANTGSVESKIEQINNKINAELTLHRERQKDIFALYQDNRKFHDDMLNNIDIAENVALKLKEKEKEFQLELENNPDSFIALDLETLRNQMNRLDTIIGDFKNNVTLAKVRAREIENIRETGINVYETVQSTQLSLIPNWRYALATTMFSNANKQSIEMHKQYREASQKAMKASSDLAAENMIESTKLSNSTIFDVKDIGSLIDKMIETGNTVKSIQKEYAEKRRNDDEERLKLEKKLYDHLVTN